MTMRPITPKLRAAASKLPGLLRRGVLGSVLLHLLAVVVLLHVRHARIAPVRLPGTTRGSRMLLTYSPGRAPAQERASLKSPRVTPVRARLPKTRVPDPEPARSMTVTPSPASANPDSTAGNDGLGTGDVNIALLTYFPVPKPDLTQLPHGTRGDVVIDVVIDATGRIVQATMSKGLGHGVDETVMATVQQWTFHPATKDGHPVASEQELLFHYEHT